MVACKPLARAATKAMALRGGRLGDLTDLLRGSLVFRDAGALHAALQLLDGLPNVALLRCRNSLDPALEGSMTSYGLLRASGGYRCVALLLRLEGYPHVAELTLHLEPLFTLRGRLAERKGAYRRYTAWRDLQHERPAF